MSEKINYLTPVGRAVTGDLFKPNVTSMDGSPLLVKSGPHKGTPSQQYVWGLAFSKTDTAFVEWYCKHIDAPARKAWPQWYNGPVNQNDVNYKLGPIGLPQCTHPAMSLKIRDGDGIDGVGKPNSNKEGYAGHWILVATSAFAPGVYYVGQYPPQHKGITDPNIPRRGYYYRMGGTIESNNNPQKPGLYVNLHMVDLCFGGQEIVSGPDAATVFGQGPVPVMPAGATALPMAQAGILQSPPALAVPPNAPVGGLVMGASPSMPTLPIAPVYVVPNAAVMAIPPAALPPLPPASQTVPPSPVMTAKAAGASYETFIAAGWTPESMRAQGYLA